jgi:hypothetical protein
MTMMLLGRNSDPPMIRGPRMISGAGMKAVPLLAVLALISGCGYRRPALVRTAGVVTLDGEPVAEATVMLVPIGRGRAISGVSDKNGRLAFSTYGSRDGVPPGDYRAVVSKLVLTSKAARRVESMRARGGGSAEPPDDVMLEFTDDDYRNELPAHYASIDTTDLAVTIDRRTRQIVLALVSTPPTP